MSFRFKGITFALVSAALTGTMSIGPTVATASVPGTAAAAASSRSAAPSAALSVARRLAGHEVCPIAPAGQARCLSSSAPLPRAGATSGGSAGVGSAAVAAPKFGLRPADIRKAYQLSTTGGKGQTIAIVDAYDDPKAESDLKVYRATWKLPACTTANKCFRKVNQRGGSKPPEGDPDWSQEISLDVQAVSAACPKCKILLVEGDEPSADSLGAAVNTAVRLGANVVSNSYGSTEFTGIAALGKKYYTHPGVPIIASSGDTGFQDTEFPADLPTTWAIGGTLLKPTKAGGWTEDAAYFGSSGCSAWFAKPSYQKDKHCPMRTVADISAVADSADGFAVYDSYGLGADNGWIGMWGTSLSAPLVAAMIGLAGNSTVVAKPSYAYSHRTGLKDVVGGSNAVDDCGGDYLCNALKGYDAPTGLGSPRGLKSL